MALTSFYEQLRLILRRNYLIKIRARRDTFVEIVFPLIFFFVLVALKQSVPSTDNPVVTQQPITALSSKGLTLVDFVQSTGLLLHNAGPNSTFPRANRVMSLIQQSLPASLQSRVIALASGDEIETFYNRHQSPDPADRVWAAVEFSSDALTMSYALRLNGSGIPDTSSSFFTDDDWQQYQESAKYWNSGFLTLQSAVNQAIMVVDNAACGAPSGPLNLLALGFQFFPYSEYFVDHFHTVLVNLGGLYFVIGFFPIIQRLIGLLVLEKERRTKEGMRMMGLRGSVFAAGWYLSYTLLTAIPCVALSTLSVVLKFYPHTSWIALFLTTFLYVQSLITLAFLLSCFFDQSKTASQFGSLATFLLFLPSYIVKDSTPTAAVALLSLSSPIAFQQTFKAIADAEQDDRGVGPGNWTGGASTGFPFYGGLLMMALDCVLYGVLAWYLDNVLQGEYGTGKPWWFCFSPRYWLGEGAVRPTTKYSELNNEESPRKGGILNQKAVSAEEEEKMASHEAFMEPVAPQLRGQEKIRVRGLRKVFDAPKKFFGGKSSSESGSGSVVAVKNLYLDMYEGQILALLGHNGAGKSTVVSVMCGLFPATAGGVQVYGRDLAEEMDSVRGLLGVCPQHDILFDQLTVREHLEFYAQLKGVAKDRVDGAVRTLLHQVGLDHKEHQQSHSLSGGEKRKLSVAIALIGDSKVIFLDEPTSGVDPYSRRKIWTLLQNYRPGRVIILTTHFMDEADLLGDRIAIMSAGQLKCVGSSLFLKNRFGIGYHLHIEKARAEADAAPKGTKGDTNDSGGHGCDEGAVQSLVTSTVAGARVLSNAATELAFVLPLKSVGAFPNLFRALDQQSQHLGVVSYGVSLTTLEEVFLAIAQQEEQHKAARAGAEGEPDHEGPEPGPNVEYRPQDPVYSPPTDDEIKSAEPARYGPVLQDVPPKSEEHAVPIHEPERYAYSPARQFQAMIYKRWLNAKRNKRALFFQFLFPILYILILLLVTRNFSTSSVTSPPPLAVSLLDPSASSLAPMVNTQVPIVSGKFAPHSYQNDTINLLRKLPTDLIQPSAVTPDTLNGLVASLLESGKSVADYMAVVTNQLDASCSLPPSVAPYNFTLVHNMSAVHGPAVLLDLVSNAILRSRVNSSAGVRVTNKPFSYPSSVNAPASGITIAIMAGLAFSYIPVATGVLLVREKECKAKHMQMVMGTRLWIFWASNLIMDLALFVVPILLTFALFAIFGNTTFAGPNTATAVLLFACYAWGSTAMTYLLSFFFSKPTTIQPALSMIYSLGGIVLYIVCLAFAMGSSSTLQQVFVPLFSLIPSFGLMWGLYTLSKQSINIQFLQSQCSISGDYSGCSFSSSELLAMDQLGQVLLVLSLVGCLCLLLALLIDMGYASRWLRAIFRAGGPALLQADRAAGPEDEDVREERVRVERNIASGAAHLDNITLQSLRKVFTPGGGRPDVVAIQTLTLGIPDGECFGLLGPNGAGKSTTMNILTGDESSTSGESWLGGHPISSGMEPIYELLGFCPQFDGLMELLTGREHLMLYGRIKGIPEHALPRATSHYLRLLKLDEHADKLSSKYSGGNKRKLALAIALMGNPRIVLLDEPSTGVDPVSRRAMWGVLSSEMRHRSVVLTTHSMEEADALSTRIGIMVRGTLRCVGSAQRLKHRFGSGYQMELQVGMAAGTDAEDLRQNSARMDALKAFVKGLLPRAVLQEDFGGKLRYAVPQANLSLSQLFSEVEAARNQYHILDYSISQTTLEQVFLSFAKLQEEGEPAVEGAASPSATAAFPAQ